MSRIAIVAALQREVAGLVKNFDQIEREFDGRRLRIFLQEEIVVVCGGIGSEAARRAGEAVIALYAPELLLSAGFAGALDAQLHVGDIFIPAIVLNASDGSRVETEGAAAQGTLITFMEVASAGQKVKLARAYAAQAVDMEAAGVAAAARTHGIAFRAVKVISDECDFEMPEIARFIDLRGRFRTANFVFFAALHPRLWPRLATLARNSSKAARALAGELKNISKVLGSVSEAKSV
jgi:adenosylhomocysteine nucleosidase